MVNTKYLDRLMADKVMMGWHLNPPYNNYWCDEEKVLYSAYHKMHSQDDVWQPTKNIEQAFMVVEKLRLRQCEIRLRGMEWYDGGGWVVEIMDVFSDKVKYSAEDIVEGPNRGSPNLAMAICLAAAQVVQED